MKGQRANTIWQRKEKRIIKIIWKGEKEEERRHEGENRAMKGKRRNNKTVKKGEEDNKGSNKGRKMRGKKKHEACKQN